MNKMDRHYVLTVRVREHERRAIERAAAREKLRLSEWMRAAFAAAYQSHERRTQPAQTR